MLHVICFIFGLFFFAVFAGAEAVLAAGPKPQQAEVKQM